MTDSPTPLFDRSAFFERVASTGHPALLRWTEQLRLVCDQRFNQNNDTLFASWKEVLANLTIDGDCVFDASGNTIRVTQTNAAQTENADQQKLRERLLRLNPWRTGPYRLFRL